MTNLLAVMPDLIRHPDVVPTEVGNYFKHWIPASAGMMKWYAAVTLLTDYN